MLDRDVRDRLQRLAQAHLVGEHSPAPFGAQTLQERDAFGLIGPKRRLQPRGQLGSGLRRDARAGAVDQARPVPPPKRGSFASKHVIEGDERCSAQLRERAHAPVLALIELGDDTRENAKLVERERHVVRLGHPKRPGRPARRGQALKVAVELFDELDDHGQEVHPHAVDFDPQLEPEPVGAPLGRLEAREPGRLPLDDAEGVRRIDVDVPTVRPPLTQGPSGERAERVLVGVDVHHIVGLAAFGRRHGLHTLEVDGPEPLDDPPHVRLRGPVALDRRQLPRPRLKDAWPRVVRAHPGAGVLEVDGNERHQALVDVLRQPVGSRDQHPFGEEAQPRQARGLRRGRGGRGLKIHEPFFAHTPRSLSKVWLSHLGTQPTDE